MVGGGGAAFLREMIECRKGAEEFVKGEVCILSSLYAAFNQRLLTTVACRTPPGPIQDVGMSEGALV
jgi:hypothetical protein